MMSISHHFLHMSRSPQTRLCFFRTSLVVFSLFSVLQTAFMLAEQSIATAEHKEPKTINNDSEDDYYRYPPGFPILVTGLPKTGTSSIHKFFACGNITSSHTFSKVNETYGVRVGACYEQNLLHSNPPFHNCGKYYAWTDNGYANTDGNCFYPSIHGLQAFVDAYPNGTLLMNIRNTTKWINSFRNWQKLLQKFRICNAPGMLKDHNVSGTDEEDLGLWYERHNHAVREFAIAHPSLRYVEVDIESPTAARQLQAAFGVKAACWMDCKPSKLRKCRKIESV